jgi:hypothetical protein
MLCPRKFGSPAQIRENAAAQNATESKCTNHKQRKNLAGKKLSASNLAGKTVRRDFYHFLCDAMRCVHAGKLDF